MGFHLARAQLASDSVAMPDLPLKNASMGLKNSFSATAGNWIYP